jgi:integrase
MASLRRLLNSPFWICCLTLPDGRRTNRSTKTTDRRLANRLADEWQTAAHSAREGQFVEIQARRVLNDILAYAGKESMSSDTAESFLRRWLAGKGTGGTVRRYLSTVQNFLNHLSAKRHAALNTIGYEDILKFIETRQESGIAPKTLSVDMRTLSAAFNLARKLGLVDSNPVERALAIRPIIVSSSRRECFEPDQIAALLQSAQGDWKTMVLLGYYTGARLGDCARFKWQSVDSVNGVLDFTAQKTGTRIVVPTHPVLGAHLASLASMAQPEMFLCPALAGKPTCGNNGLSTQFKQIMERAGIDAQAGPGLGIRRFAKLSFHSLRHSFNSALANAGVDQETRMRLTGHSSSAVNGDYTHLDVPRLRAAVEKLSSLE